MSRVKSTNGSTNGATTLVPRLRPGLLPGERSAEIALQAGDEGILAEVPSRPLMGADPVALLFRQAIGEECPPIRRIRQ
jgi:hypothetical protein